MNPEYFALFWIVFGALVGPIFIIALFCSIVKAFKDRKAFYKRQNAKIATCPSPKDSEIITITVPRRPRLELIEDENRKKQFRDFQPVPKAVMTGSPVDSSKTTFSNTPNNNKSNTGKKKDNIPFWINGMTNGRSSLVNTATTTSDSSVIRSGDRLKTNFKGSNDNHFREGDKGSHADSYRDFHSHISQNTGKLVAFDDSREMRSTPASDSNEGGRDCNRKYYSNTRQTGSGESDYPNNQPYKANSSSHEDNMSAVECHRRDENRTAPGVTSNRSNLDEATSEPLDPTQDCGPTYRRRRSRRNSENGCVVREGRDPGRKTTDVEMNAWRSKSEDSLIGYRTPSSPSLNSSRHGRENEGFAQSIETTFM